MLRCYQVRPENVEMTKLDVEEMLTSSDSALSSGAHAFGWSMRVYTALLSDLPIFSILCLCVRVARFLASAQG